MRGTDGARVTEMAPFQSNWLMMSDVCKHCSPAPCLEACPTGALFRTEFDTVVVQQDICNGCGYCQPACPFGVVEVALEDGKAHKCTLCYDRLKGGLEPACAKACPTDSIQFGELSDLHERAHRRVAALHEQGVGERLSVRRAGRAGRNPRSWRGTARTERVLSADRAARDLQPAARPEPAGQPHRSGTGGRARHDGGARGGRIRIVCRRDEWPWIGTAEAHRILSRTAGEGGPGRDRSRVRASPPRDPHRAARYRSRPRSRASRKSAIGRHPDLLRSAGAEAEPLRLEGLHLHSGRRDRRVVADPRHRGRVHRPRGLCRHHPKRTLCRARQDRSSGRRC